MKLHYSIFYCFKHFCKNIKLCFINFLIYLSEYLSQDLIFISFILKLKAYHNYALLCKHFFYRIAKLT